ncbi:MAG TPA: hypothetical protein VFO12_07440 [Sphingomicrobium sp.]|nr:hypothetical protein [Sphingomicrobium sp.]
MMASQQDNNSISARERAIDAYDRAREQTVDRIETSPLLALGGGLAIGALLAAILPRTRAEDRLIGQFGGRITGGARDAFDAATEAGREKLAELNITREAGKGAVQSLVDGLTEAAKTSGQAAVSAVRNKG